jgi:ketosteroid isomerase-like protein
MRLALIATVLTMPTIGAAQGSDAAKAQVLAETDSLFAAAARADINAVFRLFGETLHANNGALRTKAELVATHTPTYATLQRIEFRRTRSEATALGPNLVVMLSEGSVRGIAKDGTPGNTDQAAWTIIWRRTNAGWRILHMHQSLVPAAAPTPRR